MVKADKDGKTRKNSAKRRSEPQTKPIQSLHVKEALTGDKD